LTCLGYGMGITKTVNGIYLPTKATEIMRTSITFKANRFWVRIQRFDVCDS
jgi:hypothetical protein